MSSLSLIALILMLFQLSYIGAEILRSYNWMGMGMDGNLCVGRFYRAQFRGANITYTHCMRQSLKIIISDT